VETVPLAPELDSQKKSFSNMNDWLNVLVRKRIAKAAVDGEPLPPSRTLLAGLTKLYAALGQMTEGPV